MFEDPAGSESSPGLLTANRSSRGADRNLSAPVADAGATDERSLLPSLREGITLLDIEPGRGVPVLQSLVLDHLLLGDGVALWVDAAGHATTASLARLAPGRRLLDRIRVARGFTACQHYAAVCDLPIAPRAEDATRTGEATASRRQRRERSDATPEADPRSPSLVVGPAFDARYRADDALGEDEARTLQARGLARLAACARDRGLPVLVTRTADDAFAEPIEAAADHYLRCERTRLGPRFVGDEFETLVYPVESGAYYQTTFAYWRELLGARARQVGLEPASPSRPADGAAGVGTGVTAGGGTTPTPNPLLDAWTGDAGGPGRR